MVRIQITTFGGLDHKCSSLGSTAYGFGFVFLFSPVWIGETVRPELRGMSLCFTNASIVFGQFLLS